MALVEVLDQQLKVLEDNLIVGILTETNQFIPINPPSENIYDDTLRTYEGLNYVTSDNKTLLSNEKDSLDKLENAD